MALGAGHDRAGGAQISSLSQRRRCGFDHAMLDQAAADPGAAAAIADVFLDLVTEEAQRTTNGIGCELPVQAVGVLQRAVDQADPFEVGLAPAPLRDPL